MDMAAASASNGEIADILARIADLLDQQDANPHRVRAYRNGASALRGLDRSATQLVQSGGKDAITDIPGIGSSLAGIIAEYVGTGRSQLLERLEGETAPEQLLARVPGLGEELAERAVDQLGVQSLEELEQAAHDGTLAQVEGFGAQRVEGVKAALTGMLSRSAQRRASERTRGEETPPAEQRPAVDTLLDVDAEYRRKAEADELNRIAPKRFNPEGKAWLPILHTERSPWNFTVLYSNTARAHELGKTDDWVVIYYGRNGEEDQCTVVTKTQGPLKGKRVVRSREKECRQHYARNGG